MSIQPNNSIHSDNATAARRAKLESTPVIGGGLAKVHDATTLLRPTEDDSKVMVVAKRVGQAAVVTTAASVLAVAIL